MKIVRLTSDEKTAMFDNTFNDDITIKEKSRVALHSITTETAPSVVDLTAANNQMNIQIQTGSIYTPTIAPGVYNSGNNSVLFKDIGDKINEELDGNKIIGDATSFPSGAQVGMMFKCDVGASTNPDMGESGKVFVGYKTKNEKDASVVDTDGTWFNTNITQAITGGTKSYRRTTGGGDNLGGAYLHSQTPITQGCGHLSAKAVTLAAFGGGDPTTQGFFMGLTEVKPEKGVIISPTKCVLGVVCPGAGQNPLAIKGAAAVTVDETFVEGERIALERYSGAWHLVKYTAANVRTPFLHDGDDADTTVSHKYSAGLGDLYVVIFFNGTGANAKLDTLRWTPDPFLYPVTPSTYHLGVGPSNPNVSTQGFLEMSSSLSLYLGFKNQRLPVIGTTTLKPNKFTFDATNLLKDSLNAESFYVELLSLSLDCYDGLTSGRKSILAVIPVSDSDKKILYEPDFPVFIDINNQHETSLRNIRARLLNQDGSPVLTEGVSVLTLLFDG